MPKEKKVHPLEKVELHVRNKHRERYDFKQLIVASPALAQYVKLNIYGDESIDFFNPMAVKMLNKALLQCYYKIDYWDIPENYLCPPIPGRADYIHYAADLLGSSIPTGKNIHCLDIGMGANCIYPIIGNHEYGWHFTGCDIDEISVASANKIINQNEGLKDAIKIRLQQNSHHFFKGIIQPNAYFDITICNPPFHTSAAEAQSGTIKKLNNLQQKRSSKIVLNFGGTSNELWCKGGERTFITNMIAESKLFGKQVLWFTTLVSKSAHLKDIYEALNKVDATEVKTITMGQGNKISRMVAWTFLDTEEQNK